MDFYDLTDSTELGVYLLIWLDMYKERLARNTYRGYLVNIRKHVIPYLGSVKLCDLKPMMVQQLYTRLLKEGLSGTSCVYVHNTLRKALNSAVRLEILSRNPVQLVEPPRKSRIRITPLSVSQAQILVDYCLNFDNPPVSMAVLLALLLGLRRGEVLGLQWRDINPDECTVEIRRTVTPDKTAPDGFAVSDVKTMNSNRTLLLAEALLKQLLRYREAAQPNPNGFLFWHMTTDYLTKHYKAILRDCGLPDIRFHDLRHTNATLMLHSSIPAKIVSSMLGHSGIGITLDIYTHVMTDMQSPAVNVVQRMLVGEQKSP